MIKVLLQELKGYYADYVFSTLQLEGSNLSNKPLTGRWNLFLIWYQRHCVLQNNWSKNSRVIWLNQQSANSRNSNSDIDQKWIIEVVCLIKSDIDCEPFAVPIQKLPFFFIMYAYSYLYSCLTIYLIVYVCILNKSPFHRRLMLRKMLESWSITLSTRKLFLYPW